MSSIGRRRHDRRAVNKHMNRVFRALRPWLVVDKGCWAENRQPESIVVDGIVV